MSIEKKTTKSGQIRHIVHYREPSGKSREKWHRRKVDADRFAREVENQKDRGTWTDPKRGRITIAEHLAGWHAGRHNIRAGTAARDDAVIRNQISRHLGSIRLCDLDPEKVRAWVSDLIDNGYAPTTIKKAVQLLGASLNTAVQDGVIHRSPAQGIETPAYRPTEMRFLGHEEIVELGVAIHPHYRALVLSAAYTGLRIGELAALRMDQLNLLKRSLTVSATASEVRGRVLFGPPKTPSSRRQVALPRHLVEVLTEHLSDFGPGKDGLVFTAVQGGPLRRPNFTRRYWLPAVDASVGRPCRFHDLRHSHAALLIAEGVHPKVLQERLGHSSITTTLDTYGHILDGLDQAAADTLNDAISAANVGF